MTKSSSGRKGFIQLISYSHSLSLRELKQSRGRMLLTGFFFLACSVYSPVYLLAPGWHYPQWLGPRKSITNQKNAFEACIQANLMEAFSQLRFPLNML